MTFEDLCREADQLARDCHWLVPTSEHDDCATFGGSSWMKIRGSLLPAPLEGTLVISQHGSTFTCKSEPIPYSSAAELGAVRLKSARKRSLPPLDAVFCLGGQHIAKWLQKHRWPAEAGYNDNFPDPIAARYNELWMQQCPIFMKETVFAQIGGWNMPWPEGDFISMLRSKDILQVWTFMNAEPWLEIWQSGPSLRIIERIS